MRSHWYMEFGVTQTSVLRQWTLLFEYGKLLLTLFEAWGVLPHWCFCLLLNCEFEPQEEKVLFEQDCHSAPLSPLKPCPL